MEIILNVSIVYDRNGEYKAMMDEEFLAGNKFFYIMDQQGQYMFVHENDIYKFKSIGMVTTMDANTILSLLDRLNNDDSADADITYIWDFNQLERCDEANPDLPFWLWNIV